MSEKEKSAEDLFIQFKYDYPYDDGAGNVYLLASREKSGTWVYQYENDVLVVAVLYMNDID